MATIKLTKTFIEKIDNPKSGQQIYRDCNLRGFAVRAGSKSKVYIAEGQVNKRTVRCTIGRTDVMSTDIARKKAKELLCKMTDGINPNQNKRDDLQNNITLSQAFDFYLQNKDLSKGTIEGYKRTVRLYLKDWAKKPLRDITKQMVQAHVCHKCFIFLSNFNNYY